MNRQQLEHVLRAASAVVGDPDVLVIGSQAVLGSIPDDELPPEATTSIEADLAFFDDPDDEKADKVDGAIGELSPFHATNGYYAQGVSVRTAVLPEAVDDGTLDLCTASSHDCTCPPGTTTKPTPRQAPQDLRVAATGGLKDNAYASLQGISKEKWCKGTALNLTVEGEIGGQRYSGLIVGYPEPTLTCDALGNGNAVHWSGEASNTHNEIGGEFDMEFGTWTVGTAIGDRSFSIYGPGSPRQYLGGISGTVTQTATGGSIDATAANGPDVIQITGTWTCPSKSTPAPSP